MRTTLRFATALVITLAIALAAVLAGQGTASAATAIEYGLIAALISVASLVGL